MIRAVYVHLSSLAYWMTEDAHVSEGRLAVGDMVREAYDGQVIQWHRLTAARWRWLRSYHPADALVHLRAALIEAHGPDLIARVEHP